MGSARGNNARSCNCVVLLLISLIAGATCFVDTYKKMCLHSQVSRSISRTKTSRNNYVSSSGQTDAVPISISASNKIESGQTLSAALMAIVLTLPQATKASAPPTLGVDKDGFFELCPDSGVSGCVSSQDDRPACFLAPWEYEGDYMNAKRKLLRYLSTISGLLVTSGGDQSTKTLDFEAPEENSSRYIRAEITDKSNTYEDDLEFYFTPNDNTIQYRSLRRRGFDVLGLDNKNRIEKIRLSLRFLNIPILRNRRRVLFFVESPLDSFGPPTIMFDKLLDNVSGEMEFKNGVIGDLDPLSPIWETPSTAAKKIKSFNDNTNRNKK